MIGWAKWLLWQGRNIWQALLGAGVILGALVFGWLRAKALGRREQREEQRRANVEAEGEMVDAIQSEAEHRDRSADARDQRLRDAGLL